MPPPIDSHPRSALHLTLVPNQSRTVAPCMDARPSCPAGMMQRCNVPITHASVRLCQQARGSVRSFMDSDPHTVLLLMRFVSRCMNVLDEEARNDIDLGAPT